MNNKSIFGLSFVAVCGVALGSIALCGLVTLAISASGRPENSDPHSSDKKTGVDTEVAKISAIDSPVFDDAIVLEDALVPPIDVPDHLLPAELRSDQSSDTQVSMFFPFEHDSNASFHPHGDEVCASGCALSSHPTPELSATDFDRLMDEFANDPLTGESKALEALLYYGTQVTKRIDEHGTSPLDSTHSAFLISELQKTHASVAIRIVDENGLVRAINEASIVPMNRRHVFELEGNNLQSLVASGTVKRVGLDYLWTRL